MKTNMVILLLVMAGNLLGHGGKPLVAVTFNGVSGTSGQMLRFDGIGDYGVAVHHYWPGKEYVEDVLRRIKSGLTYAEWENKNRDTYSPLDASFPAALEGAQLLYIGQYTHDSAALPFQRYPEAVRKFLQNGGTVLFDYFSATPALNGFLAGVGVENPSPTYSSLKPGCHLAIPWGKKEQPLFKIPHDVDGKDFRVYGWWEKWSGAQAAPFRSSDQSNARAVIIIQEKVLGKGRIIFSQMSCAFRTPMEGGDKLLLENILSYVFGRDITKYKEEMKMEKGGPGEPAG